MPFVPIRNIGSEGLVTDQDAYNLELTQFPAGNNVSFHDGRLGKSLGYVAATTVAAAATHVQSWLFTGNNTLIVGTLNKIYRFDGSSITNVTKTSDATNYSNSARWQSAQIGVAVLMNNGSQTPQFMYPAGTRFADLPAWPSTLISACVKP
jgi:hypothetical protein